MAGGLGWAASCGAAAGRIAAGSASTAPGAFGAAGGATRTGAAGNGAVAGASRPSDAMGSAAGFAWSASIASGVGRPEGFDAGGCTYGSAFVDALSKSITIVLRSLRT